MSPTIYLSLAGIVGYTSQFIAVLITIKARVQTEELRMNKSCYLLNWNRKNDNGEQQARQAIGWRASGNVPDGKDSRCD